MVGETGKLNILMVATRYFPYIGGIETHVYEVSRRLAGRGIGITVLTTVPHNSDASLSAEEVIEGVRVIRVRAWPAQRDYGIPPQIFSISNQRGWVRVHFQGCY